MLRMAVCDKEEETCSLIKALAEESIGCKVWTFHSDTELLESKEKYDIILLDIGNGEPTGIETARKIRRCYDPILIFIAEGKKHVLDVFDVEAFHYLLKPIDEEKLKEVLKRAENHCKLQKEKEPLIIRVNGENCYVPKEEILYAENYARKVILHLGERQIAYYAKMGELEEQLGESFFRVHRGYLVNLRAVRSYHTAGVVLKNGEEILMAKSKFQKFEEVYMDFLRNSD